MSQNKKIFRLTLPSQDVDAFLEECHGVQWYAYDTGERIMTEAGPDAESVLVVEAMPLATADEPLRVPLTP